MLKHCSLIDWLDLKYDDEQTSVVITNRILRFSPTEYKLMRLFFSHRIVQETALLEVLSLKAADINAQKLITKYINKVRSKIIVFDLRIHRIHSYGYILLPSDHKEREKSSIFSTHAGHLSHS